MFVIPCKFVKEKPIIFECVKNIRNFHEEPIVIIDSSSEDKNYLLSLKDLEKNIYIEDAANINYEIGALKIAFEKYDFPHYYLLHDTMLLNNNISHLKQYDITSTRFFYSWNGVGGTIFFNEKQQKAYHYGYHTEQQKNIVHEWCKKINITKIPFSYNGVFGSSFFANKNIIKSLKDEGLFECMPTSKEHSEAMERFLGILMNKLNYNHYENSLMGEHHLNGFDSPYISKLIFGRQ